jgi:MFS transporter, ACS family, solute carrier family 17 (sodium-dependent inorganic phosphate cotransporter), other
MRAIHDQFALTARHAACRGSASELSAYKLSSHLSVFAPAATPSQYGGRYTLAAGLTAWSVFTLLTPAAAALGSVPLLACRVALGLGEGFAFPSIHAMISEYVPAQRQATVVGAVTAASYGGAALAFGASPTLAQNYG